MAAHARLSPSAAARWMRCLGSVNFLEAQDDEDEGGINADEGTILHSFCESALRENREAYSFVGETREHNGVTLELTEDLADLMQEGLDYIDGISGKLYIEHRVKLDKWMPRQFGTLDVGICGKKTITIFDWKWGMIPVSAVENYQLMIYALGFWYYVARHITDATHFRLVIWQPRAPGGGGEWEIDLDDLLAFGKKVKDAAERTYDLNAPRTPGQEQCRYCSGAKDLTCEEYVAYNLKLVIDDFDELDACVEEDLPMRLSTERITKERRSYLIQHEAMFRKFFQRLHAQALDEALKGLPVPELKAVHGRRPPRKWKDKEKAEKRIVRLVGEDDAYTKKVKSPTQIEREEPALYGRVLDMVEDGEPKPVLVSIHDSRPAIKPLRDEFDDIED